MAFCMHELVVNKTKSLVESARFISLSCDEMANSSQQSQVSIFHAYIVEDWCRNPTLAKCGGEAQHFQSWGLGVLRDSRMFRAQQQGPKHLALGRSCCH